MAGIPIIVLTGENKLENKKRGFESGIDVYLTKPMDSEEIGLWIKALFRRIDNKVSGTDAGTVEIGDLKVNYGLHLVEYKGRTIGNITARELQLFFYLLKHSPRIFSRDEIIRKIWRTHSVQSLVDIHLHNLRKKLPKEVSGNITAVASRGFRYLIRET